MMISCYCDSMSDNFLRRSRVALYVTVVSALVAVSGCAALTDTEKTESARCTQLKDQIRGVEDSSMSDFRKQSLIAVYEEQMVDECGVQ